MNLILRLFYRPYRLFTSVRYWVRRRFTATGLALLGALLIIIPIAFDADNNVAYQILCLLVALLLIAFGFGGWFRWQFEVRRTLPRFGTVGAPFHYQVNIRNTGRKTQAGLTFVETLADVRPPMAEWMAFQRAEERRLRRIAIWKRKVRHPFRVAHVNNVKIPSLSPGQSADVKVELTPLRRGPMRFQSATIGRDDPLGLFRALAKRPLPQSLTILPKRYFIPPVVLPGTMKYQQGGVAMASSVGQSDEFVSLRDYRRGDPYRHIHWRSWAKTGHPIVKEYEDEFFVRHALVLDTFATDPYSEVFEEAVSVAASFACTVQTQESLLDLLFVGTDAYCFTAGRSLGHADQLLEVLASVSARFDGARFTSLETLVLEHAASVSGCICVFVAWDEPRQKLVRKLRTFGVPLLVLVVAEPAVARKIDPGPMREDPQYFRVLEVGTVEKTLAEL